ncbi:MAG: hypothetical protein ACTSRH_00095 [Promethearchaeota archaeon]
MNFKKYIEDFQSIIGVKSVGIVNIKSCKTIFHSDNVPKYFIEILKKTCQMLNTSILDLKIGKFLFKRGDLYYVGYREQDIILLIEYERNINKNILKLKVNIFLNNVLLNS